MLRGMSRAVFVMCAALTAGCPGDPPLACVDTVDFATCQPLYPPTWDNVYANTIADSCAASRACHAAVGGASRLVLEGSERAYAALIGGGYVTAGDAACSELVERLYTRDASLLMPRGARLADPEACAIGRWVAAGAPGPGLDAGVDAAAAGGAP
jgi:hypothetical protein